MDPLTVIAAITAAAKLIETGTNYIEARRANRELTAEEAEAWRVYLESRLAAPHWTQPS